MEFEGLSPLSRRIVMSEEKIYKKYLEITEKSQEIIQGGTGLERMLSLGEL